MPPKADQSRGDVVRAIEDAAGPIGEDLARLKDHAKEGAGQIGDAARQSGAAAFETARERAGSIHHDIGSLVATRPAQALGLAAGLGALLALALNRRR